VSWPDFALGMVAGVVLFAVAQGLGVAFIAWWACLLERGRPCEERERP